MKYRGFECQKRKKYNINIWKILFLLVFLLPLFSLFSLLNKVVYADNKALLSMISSGNLQLFYENSIPAYLGTLIKDYKNHKNIFNDKSTIYLFLGKAKLVSQIFGLKFSNLDYIFYIFKKYYTDISELLGANSSKTYLVILENTSEERPDGGFFGSFAKIVVSGGYIKDFKIYDTYYLLWKFCKEHTPNLPKQNWFDFCNKSGLSLINTISPFNKFFPKTTILTSNIFGFTSLNAESVINHYNIFFSDYIDGVIFVKSDILKYLFTDGKKIWWTMEFFNWQSKIKENKFSLDKVDNLIGLKGKKSNYLLYINKLLQNKKQILINIINNFDKIRKEGLIRVYFRGISKNFKDFLQKSNFMFEKEDNYTYIFFYNFAFDKSSKFIDHLIKVNNKIYLNPLKIKLPKGYNLLTIKNIIRVPFSYIDFLTTHNVSKGSYLWPKNSYHKVLIIPQKGCSILSGETSNYVLNCIK